MSSISDFFPRPLRPESRSPLRRESAGPRGDIEAHQLSDSDTLEASSLPVSIMFVPSDARAGEISKNLMRRYTVEDDLNIYMQRAVTSLRKLDLALSVAAFSGTVFDSGVRAHQKRMGTHALAKLDEAINSLAPGHALIPDIRRSRHALARVLQLLDHADPSAPVTICGIGASIVPHCKIARDLLLDSAVGDAPAGSQEARQRHKRRVDLQEFLADKALRLRPEDWKNSVYHNELRATSWAGVTREDAADLELLGYTAEAGDERHDRLNRDAAKNLSAPPLGRVEWEAAWLAPTGAVRALNKARRARWTDALLGAVRGIAQQLALGSIGVAVANACKTGAHITCENSSWGWSSVAPTALGSVIAILGAATSLEFATVLANMLEDGEVVTKPSELGSRGRGVRAVMAEALPEDAVAIEILEPFLTTARKVGFSAVNEAPELRAAARLMNAAAYAKVMDVAVKTLNLAGSVGAVGWTYATSANACDRGVAIACRWSPVAYAAAVTGLLVGLGELVKACLAPDFRDKLAEVSGNNLIKLAQELNATRPSGLRGALVVLHHQTHRVTSSHLAAWLR